MAKLQITRCKIADGRVQEVRADTFRATINPSDYKRGYGLSYSGERSSDAKPLGNAGVTTRFANTEAETIGFSITLDATGVVPDAANTTVAAQIDALKAIAYDYNGDTHEPSVVKISWGSGLAAFYGRLTKLDVDYTLFRPSGEPLRAKLQLSFVSYDTPREEAAKAQKQSPDMTHEVIVRSGDTLPLLCQRIYADPTKYLAVAKANGLDGFRALTPGMALVFPPMR